MTVRDVAPLRHFWFEFDIPYDIECPPGTREGAGMTAIDREDALQILAERVFAGRPLPPARLEIEDLVFHRLCHWLVLPNMLEPWPRGVWFPVGYRRP